jgi:hypothetical protein
MSELCRVGSDVLTEWCYTVQKKRRMLMETRTLKRKKKEKWELAIIKEKVVVN